jgi:hypothetical protein
LDHELKVVKETSGWKAVFIRGSEKKEALFDDMKDLSATIELWFIDEDKENN